MIFDVFQNQSKCPFGFLFFGSFLIAFSVHAQVDPDPRQLLHVGINQSLYDDGPAARYLFFYWNTPDFPSTNQVVRLNYTTPVWEHYMMVGFMGGTVLNADRFRAFRVGGALPFTSEFPLYLPGYFFEELSTKSFGLAYGTYSIPFGPSKQWNVLGIAGTVVVDYINGLKQLGHWNSGVGGGMLHHQKPALAR